MTGSTSNSLTPEQIEREEKIKKISEIVRGTFSELADSAPGYKFARLEELLDFLLQFHQIKIKERSQIASYEHQVLTSMLRGVREEFEQKLQNEELINKLIHNISEVID